MKLFVLSERERSLIRWFLNTLKLPVDFDVRRASTIRGPKRAIFKGEPVVEEPSLLYPENEDERTFGFIVSIVVVDVFHDLDGASKMPFTAIAPGFDVIMGSPPLGSSISSMYLRSTAYNVNSRPR